LISFSRKMQNVDGELTGEGAADGVVV
jgi:hypothetical protein